MIGPGLLEVLQRVPDPRGRKGLRHPLSAMLAAVVCATLCGFRGVQPVVLWLNTHGSAMWRLLGFTRKPPVRQTYVNGLAELDPEWLETLLLKFVEPCVPEENLANSTTANSVATNLTTVPSPDVESWDGKTLRGTRKPDQRAEQVLVRRQRALEKLPASHAIPDETNDSSVALELVRRLVQRGTLIVADAIYCQRELCEAVVPKEADELVTVKGNQPPTPPRHRASLRDPRRLFPPSQVEQTLARQQTAKTTEKNRGRIEARIVTTTTATIDEGSLDWPGAQQLIRLKRHTRLANGTVRESTTYAITSLSRTKANVAFLLDHLRGRWHIENRGFQVLVLDDSLGDDANRTRTGHAARALHEVRSMTINLARRLN